MILNAPPSDFCFLEGDGRELDEAPGGGNGLEEEEAVGRGARPGEEGGEDMEEEEEAWEEGPGGARGEKRD